MNRQIATLGLAAFLLSLAGAGFHRLHEAEEAGGLCTHGTAFECSGCESGDHHHHSPSHHDGTLCRTCSAASMSLPALVEGVSFSPGASRSEPPDAARAPRALHIDHSLARGPPRA